jgi:HK97 family phage major capsid protein
MYTSKLVRVSFQLLQDSAFDIGGYLTEKLSTRIGRITNTHFTTGDASAKPNGVVTASTDSAVSAPVADWDTSLVSANMWAHIIDFKHTVDRAYRRQGRFMLSDATLAKIKKTSIGSSDARPLWQPSLAAGEPDTIDGSPYTINEDMADAGTATNKFMLFGDFSKYKIRDVLGMQLLRLSERYADYLQVGFIAFSRHDGDLVDAGTNPIKHLVQAA